MLAALLAAVLTLAAQDAPPDASATADAAALLGVNSDGDAARVKEILAREGLTWRNAVDGSTQGPWATAWNVQAWPTLFLIDKEGVIRHRDPRGERMLQAAREVLAGK